MYICNTFCYDMEEENRLRIFYGKRREKEKDSRYIQEASSPCSSDVYRTCNISPAYVHL